MDSIALALVLAAAFFHAGWNRLLHDVQDRLVTSGVAGITVGIVLSPFVVTSPPTAIWPLILISGAAEAIYFLFLSTAYRYGGLSLVYPIGRGTAPLLVTIGGWLILSQRPTLLTLGGAAILLCGMTVVATAGDHPTRGKAIAFALLTGMTIASYSVIDARAVRAVSPASYLGCALLLEGIILIAVVRPGRARLRAALRPGFMMGLASIASYLLVLVAFQRAHAGQVATVREVAVLIGILLARERTGWKVWLGGGLVVAGAVLAAI